jgi:hypothetical protein
MIHVGFRVGAVAEIMLLACAGGPALGALPDPLADGLRHCAGESDHAKRLACFDALVARLPKVEADQFGLTADIARKRQQPKGPAAVTATAGTASGGQASGGGARGTGTNAAATTGAQETAPMMATTPNKGEPNPGGQSLAGKITAVRQAAGGVLVFTLDNNQVWVQADTDTRFNFSIGDDVRIEHGAMGSFWLAASKGRKTKVKRVS